MNTHAFVKICGLATANDVTVAVAGGADALGFVLTSSAREISPAHAATLTALVPAGVATVAVFRSEDTTTAITRAREAGVGWIQLHGTRTPAEVAAVLEAGFKVIRAVRMDSPAEYFEHWGEDFLLIDAAVPGSGEKLGLCQGTHPCRRPQLVSGRRAQRRKRRGGARRVRGQWRGCFLRSGVLARSERSGTDHRVFEGGTPAALSPNG